MSNLTRNTILGILSFIWVLSIILLFLTQSHFPIFAFISIVASALLSIALVDVFQTKHSLLRNYPLIGRLRWVFEHERTKIQQYFIEHDTNGTPYNREKRSDVYQKAKGESNSVPFGTQTHLPDIFMNPF